jgi:hypothetical protein
MYGTTMTLPPAPRGTARKTVGGYASNGMTMTALGDAVERAIADQLGWRDLSAERGIRQGAFDLETPEGELVEVKACSVEASEYKAKPKASEVARKRAFAEAAGQSAATVIAVVEGTSALIYKKSGLGAFRLPADARGWTFEGTVTI